MSDKSLAQVLESAAKKSKRRRRISVSVSLAAAAIVLALGGSQLRTRSASQISNATLINPVEDHDPTVGRDSSPSPAPADGREAPQIVPNTTTPATSSSTDMAVVDATMCRKITEEAVTGSVAKAQWYYKQKQDWAKLYYGRWGSPEATASIADTQAFTRKWYSDYIASSDPNYKRFCHSGSSIRTVMHEPDYTIEPALLGAE